MIYQNKIIDGKSHAKIILDDLSNQINLFKKKHQITPKLAVVTVGHDPASQIYVKNKTSNAKAVGLETEIITLDETITQNKLIKVIQSLNKDSSIHGIIVQLPLPDHINSLDIVSIISPAKDVDGFHPLNVGKLHNGDQSGIIPCTPLGILYLLKHYLGNLAGKHAVIIGRSQIVGKPVAALLLQENCTVTICHSHTQNLKSITQKADIIIAAIGKPQFFGPEYFNNHSTIIDVGINRIETYDKGRLVGDVDFEKALPKAAFITPVPGGIGPMTIAFLLSNTLKAAKSLL